jgi:L-lactate dehydrogenase complex protein LldF
MELRCRVEEKGFKQRIRRALTDEFLQFALDKNDDEAKVAREWALGLLTDLPQLRQRAGEIKRRVVANLDRYVDQFDARLEEHGVVVHRAVDAEEACRRVIEIARRHHAQQVVKSKSMLSEEIKLNRALAREGIRPIESDLGEFIVQLRDELPSHIVGPAIHLRREDVAQTFVEHLHVPYTTDIGAMGEAARRALREAFFSSPVGITGVNFGVAETGTLCLVTNEGNGRMATTLPATHIALMGIERLVPDLEALALMVQLLCRSATGQKLTSYVTLVQRPRAGGEPEGPTERHVILIDNGRRRLAAGPMAESLRCIRCGACLDVCPVFRELGGHPYDSIYPGPIGSIVSPGLWGMERFGHLPKASTLCGACHEVCPVGIDHPRHLLRLRSEYRAGKKGPDPLRWGMRGFAWIMSHPARYRAGLWMAGVASGAIRPSPGWIRRLPALFSGWTRSREFPGFSRVPLRVRLQREKGEVHVRPARRSTKSEEPAPRMQVPQQETNPVRQLQAEMEALGVTFITCRKDTLAAEVEGRLRSMQARSLLVASETAPLLRDLFQRLRSAGFQLVEPVIAADSVREALEEYDRAPVGITGAAAAIAETGTLVLRAAEGGSHVTSLLPRSHFAVLLKSQIHASLQEWLPSSGSALLGSAQSVCLISGPSRSADIEMQSIVGVHGPSEVVVFCVED